MKSGDNLTKIANKYHLSVSELKKMNKLTSNSVKVKQRLLVGYEYVAPPKSAEPTPSVAANAIVEPMAQDTTTNMLQAPVIKEEPATPVVYYVKKGDTMTSIANRYHTTARKIADYNKIDGFKRQPIDTQNVLLQLNIADDYFKSKKQIELLEEQLSEKEKELYDLKHELIATQIKLENTEKNGKNLQTKLDDSSKKIIQLETQIKGNGTKK